MTMLASWCGIDTHGISSAYIVTDSRISWGTKNHFDYGKKVFASAKYPEIFGYAGDVLFPSIVLSQLVEMIDVGILYNEGMSCKDKHSIICERIGYTFSKYPDELGNNPIQIIHISRDTEVNGYPNFNAYSMEWNSKREKHDEELSFPEKSGLICVLGSGKTEFEINYDRYQIEGNTSTSRNVFHCFIDALQNTKDAFCGGPPQLVGIYRKPLTYGNKYGIIYNGKRYFLGMQIPNDSDFDNIEWRNENFELCDGRNKHKFAKAMQQPDVLRRINSATP